MIVEAYNAFQSIIVEYGVETGLLLIALVTTVITFILTVGSTKLIRNIRKKAKNPLAVPVLQLIIVEALAFLYILFNLLYYGAFSVSALLSFFMPATFVFATIVLPLYLVYKTIMEKYSVLPWPLVQLIMVYLGNLVFWAFLVYGYNLFLFK